MKYQYVGRRVEISDALKEYTEKKIGKLEKYFKKEAEAQVTFQSQAGRHIMELTVNNDGIFYRAKVTAEEPQSAVDSAVDAIERQIRKNKTRLEKRLRQGAFEREHAVPSLPETPEEEYNILRTKRFNLKPMTPEEAILQMNLLHHEFFVFRNFSNGSAFAVVYKRADGGYGLIEEG